MRTLGFRTSLLALFVASIALSASCLTASAQNSPAATQANRVAEHPDLGPTVQLKATLPGWVNPSRDAGSLPDSTSLGLTVIVARAPQVQAAFEQLLEDQQNPNSPRFHQWLTPQQIGDQFGPTQHDLDALTGWLSSQGLSVTDIAPSRVFVHAAAPASIVAKAFGTSFRLFTSNGTPHYSAASEPFVPLALSPIISSISGLTQIELYPMSHVSQAPPRASTGASATPQYTSSDGATHYIFPADFATIFDINPLYTANIKGSGQHVAVIGESTVSSSDITDFETLANIPANPPNTIVVPAASGGSNPGTVSGDEGESDLDLQRVIGVAPAVTADFVISGTGVAPYVGDQGIVVAAEYEVNTLKDPVLTLSYGSCEANAGTSGVNFWSTLFSQAAAEGISVFVSSGDSGAAGCDTSFAAPPAAQRLSINYICSNPYTTCVGGTEFNDTASPTTYWSATNGTGNESARIYIPEAAWNESTVTSVGASGGGVSTIVAKPSFQVGVGVPSDTFRDVPDVSFPAADHDGYFGCEADLAFSGGGTGNCATNGGVVFSGTSAAAPGWAGVAALLNEKLGGTGQGNLNPLIYRLGNLATGSPFHDITPTTAGVSPCVLATPSLCNNSTPSATALTGGLEGYAVTTGYDLVTGWGSVDVNNFVTAAASQASLTATTATLTATPTSPTTAQTVVFTSTVSATAGTPTGSVQFSSNGVALGSPVTLVSGVATSPAQSFTTVGTYTISAVYSGSSTFADSAAPTLTLNVIASGTTKSTSTLTATASTAAPSTPVGFTDTVTGTGGTPGGTVQFKLNGANFGSPVALAGGVATLAPADLIAGSDTVSAVYSGDNTFAASTSNSVTVTVTALTSSTSISISAPTTTAAGYLVFSGTVTGTGGSTPTGTLDLYSGGSSVLQSPIPLTNGSLAVAISFAGTPSGTYTVYWVYSGDANYASSQSTTANFTISSSFVPTYTLTATNATVTAAAGAAATNTITLASANGYSSAVALGCSASYTGSSTDTVVEPTCTFSPASINLLTDNNTLVNAASVYETSTVTLTTVVPHDIKRAENRSPFTPGAFGGAALAGLFLFSIPALRRRRSWNALACVLLLFAAAGISGCGSGGSTSSGGGGGGSLTGSPSGNYTVTVTGTGGVTTTFTLTIQ
jgi:subtilase family serine protease